MKPANESNYQKPAIILELGPTRAIGIYLVVLGHILGHYDRNYLDFGHWMMLRQFIYYFHMPLFFFVSGILYSYSGRAPAKLDKYPGFVLKKAQRLILPYLSFSLIILTTRVVASLFIDVNTDAGIIDYLLLILINPHAGGSPYLWFLYTLFICFLVFPLQGMIDKKRRAVIWFPIFLALYVLSYKVQYELVKDLFENLLFFYGGYLFSRDLQNNFSRVRRYGGYFLLVFICYFVAVKLTELRLQTVLNGFILAHLGIVSTLYLSCLIVDRLKNRTAVFIIDKLNEFSYDIYLIHYLAAVWTLGVLFYKIFDLGASIPNLLIIALMPVVSIVISVLISQYLIRKNKTAGRILLGRLK